MTRTKESLADRQRSLHEAVTALAKAIACGECDPSEQELAALAQLCAEAGLVQDVARIRRWMGEG